MQLPGLKPNVITYNAAISACERGHKPTGAATVTGDVVPGPLAQCNVITYNVAISAREKGTKPQQEQHLLLKQQLQGFLPDVITHTVAISVCT